MTHVTFPEPQNLRVNMMPIVMGDSESVPTELQGYLPLINECDFEKGSIVYLTVHESSVDPGTSQRRGGVHTEAFKPSESFLRLVQDSGIEAGSWGGGSWGGAKGVYMASTDGACQIWETQTEDVDGHGGVLADLKDVPSFKCEPNTLYWMTDKTPHEALPSTSTYRQFFRLVSEDVSAWFTEHNTPNPLGVEPSCPKVGVNKFALGA